MIGGLRQETNPMYYIVLLTTVIWVGALFAFALAREQVVLSGSIYLILGVWAVLPVAMSFDVGILRQKYALSAPLCILLIVVAAVPPVSLLGGVGYVIYRSSVVGRTE